MGVQLSFDLGYQTLYGRDNLVVSRSNCAAVEFIDQWPFWRIPITILVGDQGAGKSHLASVWCEKAKAIVVDKDNLAQAVERSLLGENLLIDGLGEGVLNEVLLFHLFNVVNQSKATDTASNLLITTRYYPSTWSVRLNDLVSRLRAVNLIVIDPPDDALLEGVLLKLLRERQLVINEHLIPYILLRIERSLKCIAEFVEILDQQVIKEKKRANRVLVKSILDELISISNF